MAHLIRNIMGKRPRATKDWILSHARAERRYRGPKGGGIRKDLQHERKVAGRFYQMLSGHAAIGTYPADRVKKVPSSSCWWCGNGKPQSRHHLSRVPRRAIDFLLCCAMCRLRYLGYWPLDAIQVLKKFLIIRYLIERHDIVIGRFPDTRR